MSRWQQIEPTNDAELWEYLSSRFGLGDWDEMGGDVRQWFRYRMVEIQKVKATRKKRGATVGEVVLAAEYVARHGITIGNQAWLYQYIAPAKRELIETKVEVNSYLPAELAAAVARERAFASPESEGWIDRLVRVHERYQGEVLEEWRQSRSRIVPSLRSHG